MPAPDRRAAALAAGLLGLVVPPRCLGCGRLPLRRLDLRLCERCRLALASGSPTAAAVAGVDGAVAAVVYDGPAVRLVARLKSGAAPGAAATMAELLAEALGSLPPGAALVPVGPGSARRLLRGLDPAEELALALGRRLQLPVRPILERRDRRPQRGRPRALRLADPPRFRAVASPPPRAVLVDDVLTTGGTLAACAAALRAAGSRSVSAAVFARTPLRGDPA